MAASYKPLFKLLIDRNMKKKELAERSGRRLATITKMGKQGTAVTTQCISTAIRFREATAATVRVTISVPRKKPKR